MVYLHSNLNLWWLFYFYILADDVIMVVLSFGFEELKEYLKKFEDKKFHI